MESKRGAESKDVTEVIFNEAESDGHYQRKASQFRNWVSADPAAEFPAESGRYVLYLMYYTLFKCNLKMIRYDYPRLHGWLTNLYWETSEATNGGAFHSTTHFTPIKAGYTYTLKQTVVPAGPQIEILPLN